MMSIKETPLQRINHLENMILIHSYIYYRKGDSIWDDFTYDDHCKELARLLKDYPEEAEKSKWSNAFEDYDASTGFDLPIDNPWVIQKAEYVYRIHTEGLWKRKDNQLTNTKVEKKKPTKKVAKQKSFF